MTSRLTFDLEKSNVTKKNLNLLDGAPVILNYNLKNIVEYQNIVHGNNITNYTDNTEINFSNFYSGFSMTKLTKTNTLNSEYFPHSKISFEGRRVPALPPFINPQYQETVTITYVDDEEVTGKVVASAVYIDVGTGPDSSVTSATFEVTKGTGIFANTKQLLFRYFENKTRTITLIE
jgi:hypothetical protein